MSRQNRPEYVRKHLDALECLIIKLDVVSRSLSDYCNDRAACGEVIPGLIELVDGEIDRLAMEMRLTFDHLDKTFRLKAGRIPVNIVGEVGDGGIVKIYSQKAKT